MQLRKSATATTATLIVLAGLGLAGCDKDKYATNSTTSTPVTAGTTTPSTATPPASATVGATIDDAATTAKVKTAMLADPDVKGLQVNVDTANGNVTLTGTVDTRAQADKAAQIAGQSEGVKSVTNNLTTRG
jgi:hyperosmotically inducible periplasmic protein